MDSVPSNGYKVSANDETVWTNLRHWIQNIHGGEIHESLSLKGGDSDNTEGSLPRGIFATYAIAKGEKLIQLPVSCVVSGMSIANDKDSPPASSWLQCVAAYYQALIDTPKWRPYFDSLPARDEYETLFQWTDGQIQQFLAGTTIGAMVEADRSEGTLAQRYELAVRPYLQKLGLIAKGSSSEDQKVPTQKEMDAFLDACMCISTRGFHLSTSEDKQSTCAMVSGNSYRGPFLLPVIDLLNHDPSRKCTTLQRDDTAGMFCMNAERNIVAGEEIFHSYGDTLTAAQLLQTFGFVPPRPTTFSFARITHSENVSLTPGVLNKTTHLLAACQHIKASDIPREIQDWIASRPGTTEEDEFWNVSEIPNRSLCEDDAPENWLISLDSTRGSILSDELITLLVIQFLPHEAFEEMIDDNGRISAWLDRSILDDRYLGKLIPHAVLEAIRRKQQEYVPVKGTGDNLVKPLEQDTQVLDELCSTAGCPDLATNRMIYGLRVRIEELLSLEALSSESARLIENLEQHIPSDPAGEGVPPAKRTKVIE